MSVPHPSQSQLRHCKHQSTHLSLPLPFLPVSGHLKTVLLLQIFPPTVKKFVCIVRNICISTGKKLGHLASQNKFCESGTDLFESHKTRMNGIPRFDKMKMDKNLFNLLHYKMECVALDTLILILICYGLHCSSYVYFLWYLSANLQWGKSYIHA
jgi:hypothetical protein